MVSGAVKHLSVTPLLKKCDLVIKTSAQRTLQTLSILNTRCFFESGKNDRASSLDILLIINAKNSIVFGKKPIELPNIISFTSRNTVWYGPVKILPESIKGFIFEETAEMQEPSQIIMSTSKFNSLTIISRVTPIQFVPTIRLVGNSVFQILIEKVDKVPDIYVYLELENISHTSLNISGFNSVTCTVLPPEYYTDILQDVGLHISHVNDVLCEAKCKLKHIDLANVRRTNLSNVDYINTITATNVGKLNPSKNVGNKLIQ